MNKNIVAGILAASVIAGITGVSSQAEAQSHSTMNTTNMAEFGKTLPPIGHVEFCRARPQECRGGSSQPSVAKLSSARWQELDIVNRSVNRQILPATDEQLFGRVEHWTYPSSYGDCEDYVLLKRHMLIARGWPAEALLITVVRDRDGLGHAVLTVATDRGDYILDNVNNKVLAWDDTEYQFLKRQSRHHPAQWVALNRNAKTLAQRIFTTTSN